MPTPINPNSQGSTVGGLQSPGNGPQFDPNYLNNLSTFMSGLAVRPQGGLYLNPTGKNPFQDIGQPTTGGNAPLWGMPWQQLDWANAQADTSATALPGNP